jgi:PIN domain nuclease of toxin-antitoxin system
MADNLLYVIDTHALIWYFIGSARLSQRLKEEIDEVRSRSGRLLVPTIVLSEALFVADKGRVKFDFDKLYQLVRDRPEFEIVGFGSEILEEAINVSGITEIHDRIIVATAKFYGAGVITQDRIILDSGDVA